MNSLSNTNGFFTSFLITIKDGNFLILKWSTISSYSLVTNPNFNFLLNLLESAFTESGNFLSEKYNTFGTVNSVPKNPYMSSFLSSWV